MAAPQALVMAIRRECGQFGCTEAAAARFGVSRAHLYGIVNGNANIGTRAARRILEAVRRDELALADKIEAELIAHWLHSGETE